MDFSFLLFEILIGFSVFFFLLFFFPLRVTNGFSDV